MLNAIKSLTPMAILVVSMIGFLVGGLWFSPVLFVKAWMAEVKMTPEIAKASGFGKSRMALAFSLTVLSTFGLAVLVADHGTATPLRGALIGLFVGTCLVGARQATTTLFELRSIRYFLIVSGHDIVTFTILAKWR